MPRQEFIWSHGPQIHPYRKKEILLRYPQVKELMRPYPWSALWICLLVASQLLLSFVAVQLSWPMIFLLSFFVGAFINHGLYVLIHECGHNLVFKKSTPNKFMGIICDIPLVLPSALAFRKYHAMHHRYLGDLIKDPDVVSYGEAKIVGNSWVKKLVWLALFSLSQALRPLKIKEVKLFNGWILANLIEICFFASKRFFQKAPWKLRPIIFSTLLKSPGILLRPLVSKFRLLSFIWKKKLFYFCSMGLIRVLDIILLITPVMLLKDMKFPFCPSRAIPTIVEKSISHFIPW